MSRIEEALRLSGRGHATGLAEANRDTFTAPWSFEDPREEPVHEEPTTSAEVSPILPQAQAVPPAAPTLLGDDLSLPITGFSSEWAHRLAISPNANPMLVEQFRRLAATLFNAQTAGTMKVIMVTSPWAGDGKTMTSLNLSLVLSESYRRKVLLIDADLRRPSISNLSRITPSCGLSDGLKSKGDQKLSVIKISENLTLLPAGRPDPDPMSSLTSTRMRRIIEEASKRFDWVILDAPPVGPVADANLLAEMTDAVLLVIRAGKTQYAAVQRAIDSIGRDRIVGVVLNGVDETNQNDYQRQYGHYYAASSEAQKS
jgi:capsular exopolysaccharide synthesis family protein